MEGLEGDHGTSLITVRDGLSEPAMATAQIINPQANVTSGIPLTHFLATCVE